MADVFDFYVQDNRKITFEIAEPIMREDNGVTDFQFHVPKAINGLDMTGWAWWFVFVNAKGNKYTEPLLLSDDPERPLEYSVGTYTVDYGMSIKAGNVSFALEAINSDTGGTILNEWHTFTYQTTVKETLQGNQVDYDETQSDIISALLIEVQKKVNQLVGGATPEVKDSIAEMTDHKKIYVLSTDGNWYRYNGTTWVSGGQYASGITIDPTLSQSGQAADAKVVGDRFSRVESGVNANSIGIKQIIAGNNFVIPYDIPWEQGVLRQNGLAVQQSYSVYTDTKIPTSNNAILEYDTTVYKINIMGYDADTDVQATAETGFITTSPINLYAQMHKPFVSLIARRVDGEDLSPEDINDNITVIHTFENTLATKNYVSNKIDALDEEFVQKSVGKNLFNKNATGIIDGYYVGYNDGKVYTNAQYCYLIMKCLPDTDYAVSNNYIHISIFDGVPVLTTGSNHVGGIVTSASLRTFHTPTNGTYMAISLPITSLDLLQIEYGTTPTAYEPYSVGFDGNEINDGTVSAEKLSFDLDNPVTNIITVKKDGTGDFDTLRGALESISDATSKNLYIVEIYEGTYVISDEYTSEEWSVESTNFIGLSVPDFVTLKGVGNKENIIITAEDTTQRTYVSTLNLRNTCSLYNLTVKGKNLRYVIHDDYAQAGQTHYVRIVENCDFIGENLSLAYVYGCGIKQGAEYHIRNCRFTTDLVNNFSFLMHNNTNWSREAFVEIENCRFLPYDTSFGCLFASMSNGAKLTYVTLKGNKMKKLRLNENSPSQYGAGIVFKVTGYGNDIDSADIVNSDGVDYSSYIDLI